MFPQFIAKSTGLFMTVFGVSALLGAIATVNPVWAYGPFRADQVSTDAQPDWYVGFLEGSLRLVPPWETAVAGHTVMWNVFLPAVVLPLALFAVLYAYPFFEAWITGDRQEHHLADRPRDKPVRTGLGVAAICFYGVLLAAGGNDVLADTFKISLNALTWVFRVCLVVVPPLAFQVTKRICLALQESELERLEEGEETGQVRQTVAGGYSENHAPVDEERRYVVETRRVPRPLVSPEGAGGDVPQLQRLRATLSSWYYGDRVAAQDLQDGEPEPGSERGPAR
jgi:ubiquinol-cytochrome c reductase cytochrome b subunit